MRLFRIDDNMNAKLSASPHRPARDTRMFAAAPAGEILRAWRNHAAERALSRSMYRPPFVSTDGLTGVFRMNDSAGLAS